MSLSDNLNLFQRCRVAKHKLCTYGAGMAKSRWSLDMTGYQPTDLSRLDFRRLPGPVFDPPSFGGWVRAHFPEQRLVIEPTTYRDPFFPRPCQKVPEKPTQYSLLQQLPRKAFDRWYCHGHSQVSSSLAAHLAVRPPLPVAPHHDFWPSRVNV